MAGTMDKLKGKAKEMVGKVIGDEHLENEGKLDQAKGSVKKAGENVKERAKEAVGEKAEDVKEMAERAERRTEPDPDDV